MTELVSHGHDELPKLAYYDDFGDVQSTMREHK